uniref:JAB1/MPN/MOV34 metalloenzyme domain-containing protein n=1 Tax=Mesocestoides corti TaxID=53468 RepID=A0A5K3FI29_MESCO
MSIQALDNVFVSGPSIGFLTSAAFASHVYQEGFLIGRDGDQSACMEIVALFPGRLTQETMENIDLDTNLRVVGFYRCKRLPDPTTKFSVNDHIAMSMKGMQLFFLITFDSPASIRQHLYQIRPVVGADSMLRQLRQVQFTICSNDYSSSRQLYEAGATKSLQSEEIAENLAIACEGIKRQAMDQLMSVTDSFCQTMRTLCNSSFCPGPVNSNEEAQEHTSDVPNERWHPPVNPSSSKTDLPAVSNHINGTRNPFSGGNDKKEESIDPQITNNPNAISNLNRHTEGRTHRF